MIADLIQRLIAAGTPPEVAAVAVAEAFAAGAASTRHPVDTAAEKRREWDRNYRRNKRNNPPESTRHPPETGGHDKSASSLSFNKEGNPKEEKKEKKKRGEKLPPDWQPKLEHDRQAIELGHDHRWMLEQAEDMRLWARANEHRAVARKLDWDLTFTTWMRRNARPRNGRAPPRKPMTAAELLREMENGKFDEPSSELPEYDLDLRANPAH